MNSQPTAHQISLFDDSDPELATVSRYRLELIEEAVTPYLVDIAMDRPEAVATWCSEQISRRPQEHMLAAYLNSRQRLIGWSLVSIGTINRAAVEPRGILQLGLKLNAAGFILAHNHPSGDPTPSAEDITFTRRIAEAGEIVGVRLIDHLVVSHTGAWVSLRRRGVV